MRCSYRFLQFHTQTHNVSLPSIFFAIALQRLSPGGAPAPAAPAPAAPAAPASKGAPGCSTASAYATPWQSIVMKNG